MAWEYNPTSRLYQCTIDNSFLSINLYLTRTQEDKGWLPIQGLALDCVWTEQKWTCQEHIEYDTNSKIYQVGTRKWKKVRNDLEFHLYQNLNPQILNYEGLFTAPELPLQCQGDITGLLKELKRKVRWKN